MKVSRCRQNNSESNKGLGRWTKEEHERFVEGIKLYGKNWKLVEDHIGTRSGAQIRSHAQKFFHRLKRDYKIDVQSADIKTLQEKLQLSHHVSDNTDSTENTAQDKVSNPSSKLFQNNKEPDTQIEAESSEALSLESFKNIQDQSQQQCQKIDEDIDESKKILEIYNSARRFLGLQENDPSLSLISPFLNPSWQCGYFNNVLDTLCSSKPNSESLQDTKLSDLIEFSECSRETSTGSNFFNLKPNCSQSNYIQKKLDLLREAPAHDYARRGFKRVKLSE